MKIITNEGMEIPVPAEHEIKLKQIVMSILFPQPEKPKITRKAWPDDLVASMRSEWERYPKDASHTRADFVRFFASLSGRSETSTSAKFYELIQEGKL